MSGDETASAPSVSIPVPGTGAFCGRRGWAGRSVAAPATYPGVLRARIRRCRVSHRAPAVFVDERREECARLGWMFIATSARSRSRRTARFDRPVGLGSQTLSHRLIRRICNEIELVSPTSRERLRERNRRCGDPHQRERERTGTGSSWPLSPSPSLDSGRRSSPCSCGARPAISPRRNARKRLRTACSA